MTTFRHLIPHSSVPMSLNIDKRIRSRGTAGGYRTIEKPLIAGKYNQNMAGVDRLDQMLGTCQYLHKSFKWYHTIYH